MAAYVIAGKADDPSFARAEYAAKLVEAACPNVFFHYEMKHPDAWKDFFCTVLRQYDFDCYPDEFGGPLVWTPQGDLIGSGSEFVQMICVEKFGLVDIPPPQDPVFKSIALDNLKQVRLQLQRQEKGLPFGERCDAAQQRCESLGLLQPQVFEEKRRRVVSAAALEVWTRTKTQGEAPDKQVPQKLDGRLEVANVGGDGGTHTVVLHPKPMVPKQMALIPLRLISEAELSPPLGPHELPEILENSSEPKRPSLREGTSTEGLSQVLPASPSGSSPHLPEPLRGLDVAHRDYRSEEREDLGVTDFVAAMEVLMGTGAVATWMGLNKGSEFRSHLDTHLQVLPYPLHSVGEETSLRFPLELMCDGAMRDGLDRLKLFDFKHCFSSLHHNDLPEDRRKQATALGQAASKAYEEAKATSKTGCCAVAFTLNWLIFLPLAPPEVGSALELAWKELPPLHPVALTGVFVAPSLARGFPETVGLEVGSRSGKLVSNRAIEEGIPEGTPEYEAASREVRIASQILDKPIELLRQWVEV